MDAIPRHEDDCTAGHISNGLAQLWVLSGHKEVLGVADACREGPDTKRESASPESLIKTGLSPACVSPCGRACTCATSKHALSLQKILIAELWVSAQS